MGLLDFGTKAQVEELGYRIGVGMQQIEAELRKTSNQSSPTIRGLALGLMQERNKLVVLISSLTQSSREKLKVKYKNEKIPYFLFVQEMQHISNKVDEATGINFFNSTREVDGVVKHVKFQQ